MGNNLTNEYISSSFQQLVQVSSSLAGQQLTDGTGSLLQSIDIQAATAISSSHAVNSDSAISSSHALNADNAISSSYAVTASYAPNSGVTSIIAGTNITIDQATGDVTINSSGGGGSVDTGSLLISASNVDATITYTKGDGSTFTNTINNVVNASTASYAVSADTSISSSHAINADNSISSSYATSALSSSYSNTSTSASHAIAADTSISSSHAIDADKLGGIAASTYARTDVNNTFTGLQTFDNITVNGTGSFAYLQSVTGSAKIIGDAFIILNNDTPTQRYAGIMVQDSGSLNNTASLQWDGATDDWFFEKDVSGVTEFGVFLGGPEYTTKGSPVYNAANTIVKGTGGHHLNDSIITDNGSAVDVAGNLNVSGSGGVGGDVVISDGANGATLTVSGTTGGRKTLIKPQEVTITADSTGSLYLSGNYGTYMSLYSSADDYEIAFTLDADSYGAGWTNGAGIINNAAPGNTYDTVIGFQNKTNYTNNAVTILTPFVTDSDVDLLGYNNFVHGKLGGRKFYTSNGTKTAQDIIDNSYTASVDSDSGNLYELHLPASADTRIEITTEVGQSVQYVIINSGASTVTWPAEYVWPGGTAPTLTSTSGSIDVVSAVRYSNDVNTVVATSAADFS